MLTRLICRMMELRNDQTNDQNIEVLGFRMSDIQCRGTDSPTACPSSLGQAIDLMVTI